MAVKRSPVGDLPEATAGWLQRASDESLRRRGQYRALVIRMLSAEDHEWQPETNGIFQTRALRRRRTGRVEPTPLEIAAALRESPNEPIPPILINHVIRTYVLETAPRKTGPKRPPRTTGKEQAICAFYLHQLQKAKLREDAGRATARAKSFTAKKFRVSIRTIETIIAAARPKLSLSQN